MTCAFPSTGGTESGAGSPKTPAEQPSLAGAKTQTGICYDCREPVHSTAPARDGRWYCESCVSWRTWMADTTKCIERAKAKLAEDESRIPPKPGWRPKVLLTGDIGPKV